MADADHATAVIVGAGVFGASTALALARRGWKVALIERATPGHVGASSGGESRLLRSSHGANALYTRMAWDARAEWQRLEAESGRSLLVEAGVLWFARDERGWESDSLQVCRELGIPVERLAADQMAELFPSVRTDDLAFGMWEPHAGVLRARTAVHALVELAVAAGATLNEGVAAHPDGGAAVVDGETVAADCTIWACGPWLAALFGARLGLTVTQQDVCFFSVGPEWRADRVPGWVDFSDAAYGAGDLDGHGFKCSPDVQGPLFDPDRDDRQPLAAHLEKARAVVAHRFPALAGAPLAGTRTCQYSTTVDTEFLISPLDADAVWVVGGGSGHGFKHGPVVGAYVADVVEGIRAPDPRFGLSGRQPSGTLRTAGHRG